MDVLQLLKRDHDQVKQFFAECEEGESDIQAILERIKQELQIHSAVEEKIFYLKLREPAEDLIEEAIDEHHEVDQLLGELSDLPAGGEAFEAKLEQLKEAVEAHVEEEESDIFAAARQALSKAELEKLGSEIGAAKEEARQRAAATRPQPSERSQRTPI